jgi:general secretion pathway protein C
MCLESLFSSQLIPLLNPATLLSRLPFAVLFVALLMLAWTLAHWTWVFVTPRQQSQTAVTAAPVLNKVLAEKAVALHWFGSSAPAGAESAPAGALSNIEVRGIYAARNGLSGFAVLVLDGRPVSAVLGKEFAPGVVLHAVYADRVEIQRNGQIETARMAPTIPPASGSVAQAGAPGGQSGLRLAVRELGPGQYGFSRTELLETLKRADQLHLLGRFGPHPRGGAVLEQSPAGGLPEKLGLKVGDIVIGINEKSLAGPGDVTRLYEQLVQSERVNVGFLRAGEKMSIGIQVSP